MGLKMDKLVVFKGKNIRRILHADEWWFSVVDVIAALTESEKPRDYWYRMKTRVSKDAQVELSTICRQLKIKAPDGKNRETDCSNTEGLFRIIQSIPSKKAEPFKKWLAKVGYERVQEIEDPELAQKRTRSLYKAKGYSDDWIEKRMRGITIREELTDEWDTRGINEQKDFGILTAEIHQATFGLKPGEHKSLKELKRENLRDHMTNLELIFSMLGEASTTEITKNKNAHGFKELKHAAKSGGKIAGDARQQLEIESGKKVVTPQNYISTPEKLKGINK
jgi:DNA-damage-inducible protein D